MTLLRRFLGLVVILAILYSGLWFAGYFVIRNQIDQLKPAETASALEDLLADEFSDDETTIDFESRRVSGFPLGYTVELEKPSLDHTLITWQAEDSVTARWTWLRPFSVDIDYAGTHQVSPALQSPLTLAADRALATVRVQPLFSARTARLSFANSSGEAARLAVNERPVFTVERFEVGLDTPLATEPGDVLLDIFGFALSDDPNVQARYQDLLRQFGNAESTLSALGLGLDRPIDHVRLRANIAPFVPLAGANIALASFISRGGNVLLNVLDVKQGNWRGRASARVLFGPDSRLLIQTCPLLRAGSSYLPVPFMSLFTFYIGGGRVDVSRDPIPEIALPDTVPPFTQRELCDVARLYAFADEAAKGGA